MFQEFQVSPTAKSAKQVKDEKLFDTLNCFDGNKKKRKMQLERSRKQKRTCPLWRGSPLSDQLIGRRTLSSKFSHWTVAAALSVRQRVCLALLIDCPFIHFGPRTSCSDLLILEGKEFLLRGERAFCAAHLWPVPVLVVIG